MTKKDLLTYRRRGLLGWPSKPRKLKNGDTTALVRSRPSRAIGPSNLTRTQEYFIDWNAERLGISIAESRDRYFKSWNLVSGGHRGRAFGQFHRQCYDFFRVFADDRATEVMDAYKIHGPVHFLTMLTYPEPQWFDNDFIVKHFRERSSISILDVGCGLAQQSRTLAEYLLGKGLKVRIALADIPTIRKDFLEWWGNRTGIPLTFLDCTPQNPIPDFPQTDLCFALEFFEHVYDPLAYFKRIDESLTNGSVLITNIGDHHRDFMHVSPKLAPLRTAVQASQYEDVLTNFIFRKPLLAI
jgi:SAM-dependent methyltransferase